MKKIQNIVTSLTKGKARTLAILNGVIGDTLEKSKSPLSLKMTLSSSDKPLTLTKRALNKIQLSDNGKICILAHGNCGSDKDWNFKNEPSKNYGSMLQNDLGHTPFYLCYNSGLHISVNGKRFSDLLEKFVQSYPKKIKQIILIGHSMGGLVYRSACYYGVKEKRKWPKHINKIFYLGSPHLGTHLEKFGKLTMTVLGQIPNPVTRAITLLGDLRSAGIKDLRHGYITEADWQKQNADNLFYLHQNKTPLLKKTNHYLICGTLSKVAGSKMGRFFGDGMVHPASGTGQGLLPKSAIPFLPAHSTIIVGISHQHLLRSHRVYSHIKQWCEEKTLISL